MSFFDDLGKQAAKVANAAAHKSAEVIEISKMKLAVKNEESKVDELYQKIGEAIYRQCAEDGDVPDYVKDDCVEIYNRKQVIDDLNEKISGIKSGNAREDDFSDAGKATDYSPAEEEEGSTSEYTISVTKEED